MDFECNKNSSIDEQDVKMVTDLRNWLKKNPVSDALVNKFSYNEFLIIIEF